MQVGENYCEDIKLIPKFSVGDEIWFCNSLGYADYSYVKEIRIKSNYIGYIDTIYNCFFLEEELFKTKEDLIEYYHGD